METHMYTPILVSKEGELLALSYLLPDQKSEIVPLIQLIPDQKEDRVNDYVKTRVKPILESWVFLNNRLYLDNSYLHQYEFSVIQRFFNSLKEGGVHIIPVIYTDSAEWILDFYKDYTSCGVCLRIRSNEINAQLITSSVEKIKNRFSLNSEDIDLLIDFGMVSIAHENNYANSLELLSLRLDSTSPLRKYIISAGSFPANLNDFAANTKTPIRRVEWSLWNKIKNLTIGGKKLIYSDYGNTHPSFNLEATNHQGSCSIKYTTEDHFYIYRGQRAQDHPLGMRQYKEKANELINDPVYSGPGFSWGDQFITYCAEGRESSGTPAIWVRVTQNHHFVKILELLHKD